MKEPPQGPGAEAQSEGPMWEFSSACDVRFAQLILKAQLGGGSSVHCSQPPANVFALEPRPRGGSWQWIVQRFSSNRFPKGFPGSEGKGQRG